MNKLPAPDAVCKACGRDNRTRKNNEGELPFALLAGKYLIGHALGRGGFGITYVGMNVMLGSGLQSRNISRRTFPPEPRTEYTSSRYRTKQSDSLSPGNRKRWKKRVPSPELRMFPMWSAFTTVSDEIIRSTSLWSLLRGRLLRHTPQEKALSAGKKCGPG